jgi:hypothetical protein
VLGLSMCPWCCMILFISELCFPSMPLMPPILPLGSHCHHFQFDAARSPPYGQRDYIFTTRNVEPPPH